MGRDTRLERAHLEYDDGSIQKVDIERAVSFSRRFMGLMGRKEVPKGYGLLFERCPSIHMMFMRVPLDVLWLAEGSAGHYPVVGLTRSLRPWRMAFGPKGAVHVVEFRAQTFTDRPSALHFPDGLRKCSHVRYAYE